MSDEPENLAVSDKEHSNIPNFNYEKTQKNF